MTCTGADNVHALAINGSFDDAQLALKELFADQAFRTTHLLSAVNSSVSFIEPDSVARVVVVVHIVVRLDDVDVDALNARR